MKGTNGAILCLLALLGNQASVTDGQISSRIVGGTPAAKNDFPFQAGIFASNVPISRFCGGTLISANVVLTVAHCLADFEIFDVVLGTTKVFDKDSVGYTKIKASRKLVHPNYNPSTFDNNIGLLFLSHNAPIAYNIKPILLPRRNFNSNLAGRSGRLLGWGTIDDAEHELFDYLLQVEVPIVDNRDCISSYGSTYINDKQICVGTYGGTKGACEGDSGGPLTLTENGELIQGGIMSFGASQGCTAGYPMAFTKVSTYLQWIADNGGPSVRG